MSKYNFYFETKGVWNNCTEPPKFSKLELKLVAQTCNFGEFDAW
jgi:hypothetical protein